METGYCVKFWVNHAGIEPVAKWMKELSEQDREYLGGLLRDLAAGDKGSQKRNIEVAKARLNGNKE